MPGCVGYVHPVNAKAERHHVILGVGGNRIAGAIQDGRAIDIQLVETQAEELHDFARVVFVGVLADGGLVVVDHVQVVAHRRRQRDVFHDVVIIAERVFVERAQVIRVAQRIADLVRADHPQFVQRQTGAAAELVATGIASCRKKMRCRS